MVKQKALKVVRERRRIGIVADSFKTLTDKCKKKFSYKSNLKLRLVLEEDGTEVDEDYFSALTDHTSLVLLKPGEEWNGVVQNALELLLGVKYDIKLRTEIEKVTHDSKNSDLLSHIIALSNDLPHLSSRDEHQDWFKEVDSRFKTKEDYMRNNARQRIRSYLKDAKKTIHSSTLDKKTLANLNNVLEEFSNELKTNDGHGSYFLRSSGEGDQLCDDTGMFNCQGAFDEDMCQLRHVINPYASHQKRVVFSTWNLDHVIEKSREVIPSLIKAAEKIPPKKGINIRYFYKLLFTRENLKLVHIVCHKKTVHSKCKCDVKKFHVKA